MKTGKSAARKPMLHSTCFAIHKWAGRMAERRFDGLSGAEIAWSKIFAPWRCVDWLRSGVFATVGGQMAGTAEQSYYGIRIHSSTGAIWSVK
jgi:hypothetical protein